MARPARPRRSIRHVATTTLFILGLMLGTVFTAAPSYAAVDGGPVPGSLQATLNCDSSPRGITFDVVLDRRDDGSSGQTRLQIAVNSENVVDEVVAFPGTYTYFIPLEADGLYGYSVNAGGAWTPTEAVSLPEDCETDPAPAPEPKPLGTGAVSIKGPSSELLPGVTVEIRKDNCNGQAVWRTTTTDRPDAYGAFGIGLEQGTYCIRTLSVPSPYSIPADVTFNMEARPANWVTVWVPGPVMVTGALVAKNSNGTPINGVTAYIREGSCNEQGRGVWQNTTAANRWAEGGFGITLATGVHCVSTLAVPTGYQVPAPYQINVTTPSPYWITTWVPGTGPSTETPAPYYANCAAVRAAGAAPIYRGQPGYGPHLDRDGDGVACEL